MLLKHKYPCLPAGRRAQEAFLMRLLLIGPFLIGLVENAFKGVVMYRYVACKDIGCLFMGFSV